MLVIGELNQNQHERSSQCSGQAAKDKLLGMSFLESKDKLLGWVNTTVTTSETESQAELACTQL